MAFVPSLAGGGSHASRAPLLPLQVPRAQAAAPLSPEHPAPVPATLASAALAATAFTVCALRRQRRTALSARKKWFKKFDDGPGSSAPLRQSEKRQLALGKYEERPLDESRREVMGPNKKKEEKKKKEDPDLKFVSRAQMRQYGKVVEERDGRQFIGTWMVPEHPEGKGKQQRILEQWAKEENLQKQREFEEEQVVGFNRTLSPMELGEIAKEFQTERPNPTVTCKTNIGDFQVEVFLDKMPITASNFLDLSFRKFYNGLHFHRVVKDFIIQFGDPCTQEPFAPFAGMHGPEENTIFPIVDGTRRWVKRIRGHIPDEFDHEISNLSGTLSMANQGKDDTGGSQFFINISDNAYLDWFDNRAPPAHPVFGKVIQGWKVVKAISDHDTDRRQAPLEPVRMIEMIVDDWVDDEEETKVAITDGFGQRRLAAGEGEEGKQKFQARKRREIEKGSTYGLGRKGKMFANTQPLRTGVPLRREDIRNTKF